MAVFAGFLGIVEEHGRMGEGDSGRHVLSVETQGREGLKRNKGVWVAGGQEGGAPEARARAAKGGRVTLTEREQRLCEEGERRLAATHGEVY
jgi:hypothetical protein